MREQTADLLYRMNDMFQRLKKIGTLPLRFPYVWHVNIVVPQMKAKCYKSGVSEAQEGLFVASIEGPPRT